MQSSEKLQHGTGGKLKLGPRVLYGSISKMLEAKLIEEAEGHPNPHLGDELRRCYRITKLRRKVVQEKPLALVNW